MIAPTKGDHLGKRTNLVSFLLDRTGSMGPIWGASVDGFNEFLKGQQSEDYKTVWNLTVFDSISIDKLREGVNGKKMTPLGVDEVFPRSMTPLHDAIGSTILETEKLADDYDGVIFVIMTDGLENASKEYNLEAVRALVRKHEDEDNWQFIFLGANMDAYQTGIDYGIKRGSTVEFAATPESVEATYAQTASVASAYGASGQSMRSHTDTKDGTTKDRDTEEVSN